MPSLRKIICITNVGLCSDPITVPDPDQSGQETRKPKFLFIGGSHSLREAKCLAEKGYDVITCAVSGWRANKTACEEMAEKVQETLRGLCEDDIIVVHCSDKDEDGNGLWSGDPVHPTTEGYSRIVDMILSEADRMRGKAGNKKRPGSVLEAASKRPRQDVPRPNWVSETCAATSRQDGARRGGDRGRPPFRGRGRGWVRGRGDAGGRGRGKSFEHGQRRGGGQYY